MKQYIHAQFLKKTAQLLPIIGLLFVQSCRSNISDDIDQIARSCGYDARSLDAKDSAAIVKFALGSDQLALDQLEVKGYLATDHSYEALSISEHGCVQLEDNRHRHIVARIRDSKQRAFLSQDELQQSKFHVIELQAWQEPNFDLFCPTLSNGQFELPYRFLSETDFVKFIDRINITWRQTDDREQQTQTFLADQVLALANSPLTFKIIDSGDYLLGYQLVSAFDIIEDSAHCQVKVLRENPQLLFEKTESYPQETDDFPSSYLVSTNSRLPIAATNGSLIHYCFRPINTDAAKKVCKLSSDIVFTEAGEYDVTLYAIDPVENRSDEHKIVIKVDADAPNLKLEWQDAALNLPISAVNLPQRVFHMNIKADDDISSNEQLSSGLQCKVRFIHANGVIEPGNFASCLSAECQKQKLMEKVPCGETFSFRLDRLPENSSQEIDGILSVEVSVEDEMDRTATAELQTIISQRNFPKWKAIRNHVEPLPNEELNNSSIKQIIEASDGTIWFASAKHLYFLEDEELVNWNLAKLPIFSEIAHELIINELALHPDYQLLIATSHGLVCLNFDGTYEWISDSEHGLSQASFDSIWVDEKQNIWTANFSGYSKWNRVDNSWKPLTLNGAEEFGPVQKIVADGAGQVKLFFGKLGIHFQAGNGASMIKYPLSEFYKSFTNPSDAHIQVDRDNKIWLMGWYTLQAYQSESEQFEDLGWDSFHFEDQVEMKDLAIDGQQRIWLLSSTAIYFLHSKANEWSKFELTQLDSSYSKSDAKKEFLTSLFIDSQDRVWAGGRNGVYVFEEDSPEFISVPLSLPSSRIKIEPMLFETSEPGRLSPYLALDFYDNQDKVAGFHRIKRDDNGNLWALSEKSLLKLDGMVWQPVAVNANDRIMDFTLVDGGLESFIWYEPLSVYFYDLPVYQFHYWDRYQQSWQSQDLKLAFAKEFTQSEVFLFRGHDQAVWMSCPLGIAKWQDGQWQSFPKAEGAPAITLKPNSFIETRSGEIFASDGQSAYHFKDGKWSANSEFFPFIPEQFVEDPQNQLWVLSKYGPAITSQLARYENGKWEEIATPWEVGDDNNSIAYLGLTDDGTVFVAGRLNNYAVLEQDGWQLTQTPPWRESPLGFAPYQPGSNPIPNTSYRLGDSTLNDKIRILHHQSQVWISKAGQGVYIYDPQYADQRTLIQTSRP
ncbi:MAG: hypothetical protein ACOH5I_16985 [Oligoflexus sp.]